MQKQFNITHYHHKRYVAVFLLCSLFAPLPLCNADEAAIEDQSETSSDQTELKSISDISTDITPPQGDLPKDVVIEPKEEDIIHHVWGTSRPWLETNYVWEASNLRHQPLYFEEINTERHGYRFRFIQPVVSAGRFFGTVPLLPYQMGAHSPHELQYTLGYYRPGNAVPLQNNYWSLSIRGAAYQAVATLGAIYIIP